MPQVYIIPSRGLCEGFTGRTLSWQETPWLDELAEALIPAVEEGFGIEGKKDASATVAAPPVCVEGEEAALQIEIRYTVGEDEYGMNKPFEPSQKDQQVTHELIRLAVVEWLSVQGLPADTSFSVWFKPYHGGSFKMYPSR
jgi:hypothetical protein